MDIASCIWEFFKSHGLNDYGCAGILGNLYAESGLNPQNLQNTYEKSLGFTDETYADAVDNGTYTNFAYDKAGWGLAQWTYWSRKQNLLDFAKNAGKSISDLNMQLEFLVKELSSYGLLAALETATSVREASDIVLLQFEKPASVGPDATAQQREDTCVKRANYGQTYFDQFAMKKGAINNMSNSPLVVYTALSPNCSTRTAQIDKITIHHAAGVGTVESIGNVFAPASRQASANYGIGNDGCIGLYVPEDKRAWTSSNTANDNRAVTIEVSNCATGGQWPVSDAAYNALIDLCVDICQRNGIERLVYTGDSTGNLTRHNMFAATACPGPYLQERFPDIAQEVNKRLEDDNMDVVRFKELWGEMRKELQDNDCNKYSEEARTWAVSTGLISGGDADSNGEPNYMWEDILTREQFVTVLYRFAKLMGGV